MLTFVCADPAIQVPPIFVFEGKMVSKTFIANCESEIPGVACMATKSGGTEQYMFESVMQHFIKNVKAQNLPKQHCVLFLDAPEVHMSSAAFQLCSDNDIIVIRFPSQTTNWFQPLV
jgi:DDE superfamily endonuclease